MEANSSVKEFFWTGGLCDIVIIRPIELFRFLSGKLIICKIPVVLGYPVICIVLGLQSSCAISVCFLFRFNE